MTEAGRDDEIQETGEAFIGQADKAELNERLAELLKTECRELISESVRNIFSPVAEMEMMCKKELLTEKEVEVLFSIPVATLRTERCRNRGPGYIKDGKRVLYPLSGLKEYLRSRTIRPKMNFSFEQ